MDHLWSPWRYKYIASADKTDECVFCRINREQKDAENFVVHRATLNFIVLNLFPYTSGHLMIVPYEHKASLVDFDTATTTEMLELAKRSQLALEAEYHPDGFNIGMNLGRSAGAGRRGSSSFARRASLERRCQLRFDCRRDSCATRGFGNDARETEQAFQWLSL